MIPKPLVIFLFVSIPVTLFCALGYVEVQQVLRLDANDPQIQQAEDTAARLDAVTGSPFANAFVGSPSVQVNTSLSTFRVAYDDTGLPVSGTGTLNGALPTLPSGVTDYVRAHGEDRFTWEPQPSLRFAAVVAPVSNGNGFVLAARSLREVEIREDKMMHLAFAAWLVGEIVLLIASLVLFRHKRT